MRGQPRLACPLLGAARVVVGLERRLVQVGRVELGALVDPAGSRLGAGAAVQLQRGASKRSCNITDREGWLQLMLLWAAQLLKLTCVLLFVLLHALTRSLTRSLTRTRVVRDC